MVSTVGRRWPENQWGNAFVASQSGLAAAEPSTAELDSTATFGASRVPAPAPETKPITITRAGWVPALVFVVALVITALLSSAAYVVNSRTENRLLKLKVNETAAVLQVSLPAIQSPLAAAAEIATNGQGDVAQRFHDAIIANVGSGSGQFISASLWQLADSGPPRLLALVGPSPKLAQDPAQLATFMQQSLRRGGVSVLGLLKTPGRRLGYGYRLASDPKSYVVYGERPLADDPMVTLKPGSAFSDLRFRLYLGAKQNESALLLANTQRLGKRTSSAVLPFGDQQLALYASPDGNLSGTLSAWLWWIVLLVGAMFAVIAATVAHRLVRRRMVAEALATEVHQLLVEQSAIAEYLQRALLPQRLPVVPGVEVAARYLPGTSGMDVGGDWFDVIPLGDRRMFFAVGDVSGRGIEAAAVMASMHFAMRAFVSEAHPPAEVLQGLTRLLDIASDNHFATVLCGIADLELRTVRLASAGHLPALMVSPEGAVLLPTPVGPPIGVRALAKVGAAEEPTYQEAVFPLPADGTLIVFTDGLVERRGESIDAGLERLKTSVLRADGSLDDVLAFVLDEVRGESCDDDTAVLGARWR